MAQTRVMPLTPRLGTVAALAKPLAIDHHHHHPPLGQENMR
jgi:hypothetical protein